jgi:hypothetical protein
VRTPAPDAHKIQSLFHSAFHAGSMPMERKAALRKFLRACVNIDVLDLEIVGRKPTGSGSDIGDLLSVLIQDLAGLRQYLVAI